jgi:hypothetical protein
LRMARWVEAPHSASSGTAISPIVSAMWIIVSPSWRQS